MIALLKLRKALVAQRSSGRTWTVPAFVLTGRAEDVHLVQTDACNLAIGLVSQALDDGAPRGDPQTDDWSERVLLELNLRTACAFVDSRASALKAMALLPFWRGQLGVTDIVVLPTNQLGVARRKGRDGSLFAISNPFRVADWLADELVADLPASVQYRAFIEMAGILGIRVGSIVPMATLAIDSPLFRYVPELGYWWRCEPGRIADVSNIQRWTASTVGGLPLPTDIKDSLRDLFSAPPARETLEQHASGDASLWVGRVSGSAAGVSLCNAFPDIGGDSSTYAWRDVVALNFTGEAGPRVAGSPIPHHLTPSPRVRTLISASLAWRSRVLGEDLIWVDLSSSIPGDLLEAAVQLHDVWCDDWGDMLDAMGRGTLPLDDADSLLEAMHGMPLRGPRRSDRAFPEIIGEELWSFAASSDRVRVVSGPLAYCVGAHSHRPEVLVSSLRHYLSELEKLPPGRNYLAMVSNHDTRPVESRVGLVLFEFFQGLPGSIASLFSGFEWGERTITNKEFGFDREALAEEELALFTAIPFDWCSLSGADGSVPGSRHLARVKQALNGEVAALRDMPGFRAVEMNLECPHLVAYERWSSEQGIRYRVIANFGESDCRMSLREGVTYWGHVSKGIGPMCPDSYETAISGFSVAVLRASCSPAPQVG
jgi:hypothetical protein